MLEHSLRHVDDTFLETAPIVVHAEVDLDASPEAVWRVLESDRMWSWFPGIDRLAWVSPRPLTQGCIRTLRVARLLEVEEEFYRWDENRRATFRVTRASSPLLSALVEDFLLTERGSRTRLTWTMAIEPKHGKTLPLGPLGALLRPGNTHMLAGIRGLVGRV